MTKLQHDAAEASLLSASNTTLVETNMELTAERDEALEALGLVVECCKAQSAEQTERFMQCAAERDEAVRGLTVALEALLTQEVELQQQRVSGRKPDCSSSGWFSWPRAARTSFSML